MADCSADGATGCLTVTGFPSANTTGAAAKILTGQTLAGVSGSATVVPANCSADGQTNCVAVTTFPALQKSLLTEGLLKNGTVINGVTGAYPNATYPLAGSTAAVDLTAATFNAQVKSATAFEYFDSTGSLQTGAGDADITAANIKSAIDIFSSTGTFGANCTADGATDCLATSRYKSMDTDSSVVSTWDIRSGKTLGGISGSLIFYKNFANLTAFNRTTGTGASASTTVADAYDVISDSWSSPVDVPTGFPAAVSNWLRDSPSDSNIDTQCDGVEDCVYKDLIANVFWAKDDGVGRNWEDAITYCEDLNYGTYSDWRLPSYKEMAMGHINRITTLGTILSSNAYVWVSTSRTSGTAWVYSVPEGYTTFGNKTNQYVTLCVR